MEVNEILTKLRIDRKFLSISALTNFAQFNSSPRGEMLSRQITKSIILDNGEVRILLSGLEREYGKTVFDVSFDNDITIYTIIPKYNKDLLVEVIVFYQDNVTLLFDYRVVPTFIKYHPKFGANVRWAEGLLDLQHGDIIPTGVKLAISASADDDGYLRYGLNVNVALTSHLETGEDAVVVTQETLDKFSFTVETEYNLTVKSNEVPLNRWGTIDRPRVLPMIGDKVPEHGYIFGTRTFDEDNLLTKFNKKALMEFDPMFDSLVNTKMGQGIVSDVTVQYNKQAHKKPIFPELEEQLMDLVRLQNKYEDDFITTVDDITSEYGLGVKFDDQLHCEAVRLKVINHPNVRPVRKRSRLDPFTIVIKVKHNVIPNKGFKISGLQGDKGIITSIREQLRMPVDANGRRADLLMFYGSIIGRMNIGRVYEQYITGAVSETSVRIKDMSDKNVSIVEMFNYLLGFLKIFENEQYEIFSKFSLSEQTELMKDIVNSGLRVYLPTDNLKTADVITIDIANSIYKTTKGKVSFVEDGENIVTKDSIIIAPMYMVLLSKIADTWLSVASPKLNHFGIPSSPTKNMQQRFAWSPTPVRYGNAEFRLLISYSTPEAVINIKERANSIPVQQQVYRSILSADNPVDIEDVCPRSTIEYGTDAIVKIIDNVQRTFGLDLEYKKEEW